MPRPVLNPYLCNLCAGCTGVCSFFSIVSGRLHIDEDACTGCGMCITACPNNALGSILEPPDNMSGVDILVVGGGPAGLAAGYWAAKAGADVLVVERKKSLETPLSCAEGVSTSGFAQLRIPIRDEWIASKIEGGILVSPSGLETVLHHPDAGYILNRRKLATDLSSMIADAGGRVMTDTALTAITAESCTIRRGNEEFNIKPSIIIAADGIEGSVKKLMSLSDELLPPTEMHSAAQYVVHVPDMELEYPTFLIGSRYAPGGYLWLFPKGDGRINIGLGVHPAAERNARSFLDKYIADNLPKATILESTGGIIPTTKFGRLRLDNILFVGDAAWATDPLSGGGIERAFETGRIAGEYAAKAFAQGDLSILSRYEKDVKASFGRRHSFMYAMRNLYQKLDDTDIDYVCELINSIFHGRSVTSIDIQAVLKGIIKKPRILKILTGIR